MGSGSRVCRRYTDQKGGRWQQDDPRLLGLHPCGRGTGEDHRQDGPLQAHLHGNALAADQQTGFGNHESGRIPHPAAGAGRQRQRVVAAHRQHWQDGRGDGEQDQEHPERDILWQDQGHRERTKEHTIAGRSAPAGGHEAGPRSGHPATQCQARIELSTERLKAEFPHKPIQSRGVPQAGCSQEERSNMRIARHCCRH